jgi:hypothetical protein
MEKLENMNLANSNIFLLSLSNLEPSIQFQSATP